MLPLKLTAGKPPRFARNFLAGEDGIQAAIKAYVGAVKRGEFPDEQHSFA